MTLSHSKHGFFRPHSLILVLSPLNGIITIVGLPITVHPGLGYVHWHDLKAHCSSLPNLVLNSLPTLWPPSFCSRSTEHNGSLCPNTAIQITKDISVLPVGLLVSTSFHVGPRPIWSASSALNLIPQAQLSAHSGTGCALHNVSGYHLHYSLERAPLQTVQCIPRDFMWWA